MTKEHDCGRSLCKVSWLPARGECHCGEFQIEVYTEFCGAECEWTSWANPKLLKEEHEVLEISGIHSRLKSKV